MKTIYKYIMNLAVGTLVAGGMSSCSDFLQEYSQDLSKVESWQDLDEVLIGSAYLQPSAMAATGRNGDDIECLHFMSDEIKQTFVNEYDNHNYQSTMYSYYTWQPEMGYNPLKKYVGGDDNYWNNLYGKINVCNMVIYLIDEQPENDKDDAVQKQRVKGEAYFLRAAYYFLLANMYAKPYDPATAASTPGVPVKTTEFVQDEEYVRESLSTTYSRIIDDLSQAESLLNGTPVKSLHRATYSAALLLKSRVYLYMQDWKNAARYASLTLDQNRRLLDLHTKAVGDDCVYLSSPETLFSMGGYRIADIFSDNVDDFGNKLSPHFCVSDEMNSKFSAGDLRSQLYIGKSEVLGVSPVFIKRNGQFSKRSTISDVSSTFLLRTPEAYLILAEASAFDNNENLARTTLESFMNTRYEEAVSVSQSGNDLIDLIREERAREFILEGHRWFDLRRYTVCKPYRWSKTIEHAHGYYAATGSWGIKEFSYAEVFRLEEFDEGYTLPIPRPVREFQPSIGNNTRPQRDVVRVDRPDDTGGGGQGGGFPGWEW